jgi:hypothetical protein
MIKEVCRNRNCEVPRRKRLGAESGTAREQMGVGGLKTRMRNTFRAEKSEKNNVLNIF